MQLTTLNNRSDEVDEDQSTDSVFDFLYFDAKRAASLLSQFNEIGHIVSQNRRRSVGHARTSEGQGEVSGGLAGVASAKGSHKTAEASNSLDESNDGLDPYWTNALSLMDELDGRQMISRDLEKARVGEIVLCEATISIRDLSLLQEMMSIPELTDLISMQQREKGTNRGKMDKQTKLMVQVFSKLPSGLQLEAVTDDGTIWATLAEQSLIVGAADLILKHGSDVPGKWHVLGMLDALPRNKGGGQSTSDLSVIASVFNQLTTMSPEAVLTNGVRSLYDSLAPFGRLLMGRRDHQFGITPLLIFRQIESPAFEH